MIDRGARIAAVLAFADACVIAFIGWLFAPYYHQIGSALCPARRRVRRCPRPAGLARGGAPWRAPRALLHPCTCRRERHRSGLRVHLPHGCLAHPVDGRTIGRTPGARAAASGPHDPGGREGCGPHPRPSGRGRRTRTPANTWRGSGELSAALAERVGMSGGGGRGHPLRGDAPRRRQAARPGSHPPEARPAPARRVGADAPAHRLGGEDHGFLVGVRHWPGPSLAGITRTGTVPGIPTASVGRRSRSWRASSGSQTCSTRCASDRPYKPAWEFERSLEEIRHNAGRQFDPDLVPIFISIVEGEPAASPIVAVRTVTVDPALRPVARQRPRSWLRRRQSTA